MKLRITTFILLLLITIGCSKDESNPSDNNPDPGSGSNPVLNVNLNRQAVGSSANDLLSDDTFQSMVIELVYVEGFAPTQTTINNLVAFIEERTFKPGGITVEQRSIPEIGNQSYSIQEISEIEIEHRQFYNTDNRIAVWMFFADGEASTNNGNNFTLGSAYWNTSFVLYQKTIQDFSGGTLQPNQTLLETTVVTHEFGHILGLVDLGSNMQEDHEDQAHPKHCNEENCLMYWSTESSAGIDNMLNMQSAPQLDAQCIADLQANGGR